MNDSPELTMDCIVVGGVANGALLRQIRADAGYIELKRPAYIKPVESPNQDIPDIHHDSDTYMVHPIGLTDDGRHQALFGIAVKEGMTLTEGFSTIIRGYVENVTTQLIAAGLVEKH